MSCAKTCNFYLRGNCKFGSSCRFSHSDGQSRNPNRNSHYDDYERRNANQQYYGNKTWKQHDRGDYRSIDGYEQNNYSNNNRNNNQCVKKNYNNRNDYYEEKEDFNNDYSVPTSSNSRNNNQYVKKNSNNRNDYYVDEEENLNQNYSVPTSSNRYKKNSDNHVNNNFKKQQGNLSQKEKILKFYSNEVKMYQSQMNQMLVNNYWPLSCYNPISNSPTIEPVGSLNLMDVSFEEIRCDYYSLKNICADPHIHAQVYEDLLLKAKKQKEDIISLKDQVLDDLATTFEKYELTKTCSTFQNSIPVDHNSYWDMSSKHLKTQSDKTLETFSFSVLDKVTDTKDTGPKILMQTEVYGKMDNGFDQEHFIDYVPIMPPPKKYCH